MSSMCHADVSTPWLSSTDMCMRVRIRRLCFSSTLRLFTILWHAQAGEGEDGRMKSAIGIGALLMDGLGDTIRVSLTEDPEKEIDPCRRAPSRTRGTFGNYAHWSACNIWYRVKKACILVHYVLQATLYPGRYYGSEGEGPDVRAGGARAGSWWRWARAQWRAAGALSRMGSRGATSTPSRGAWAACPSSARATRWTTARCCTATAPCCPR